MIDLKKILILLISFLFVFAIKVEYGGHLSILLNEPVDFKYSTTNYSDTIFYSFIHENFFYMNQDGVLSTNIFKKFYFDNTANKAVLELKENLSFSNGSPITGKNVYYSLKVFFGKENSVAKKISRSVNRIKADKRKISIFFNYKIENIFKFMSNTELVMLAMNENAFSGMLIPDEWERGKFIKLIPNRFYPGGRVYLNGVTVRFDNNSNPDVFLSDPRGKFRGFKEFDGGIYENIYLTFPTGKTGKNTKIALYSFLKIFFNKYNFVNLSSITSEKESPVSVTIKEFSMRKIRSLLRNSQFKLFVNASLKKFNKELTDFINLNRLKISLVFIKNDQIRELNKSKTSIKFFLTEKLFSYKTPIEDKIKRIIFELTFSGFNEKYLQIVNELDEIKYLKDNELLMDKISSIVVMLINKEFILPIKQKLFSLYCKDKYIGLKLDYYGRPIFNRVRLK